MGLNFFVGEVQTQTSEAMRFANQASQAAGYLQDGVSAFLSAPLSSQTYDTAKRYFSVAYTPLQQAIILTSEAYSQAHQKLLNEYNDMVGGGDIEEDRVREKIQQGQAMISRLEELMVRDEKGTVNANYATRISELMASNRVLEKRLEKLYAYDGASASFFSEYEARLAELEAGAAVVSNSQAWNASSGAFDIKKLDMNWAKPITKAWENREKKLIAENVPKTLADCQEWYWSTNQNTWVSSKTGKRATPEILEAIHALHKPAGGETMRHPLADYYDEMIRTGINPWTGKPATKQELATAHMQQWILGLAPVVNAGFLGHVTNDLYVQGIDDLGTIRPKQNLGYSKNKVIIKNNVGKEIDG